MNDFLIFVDVLRRRFPLHLEINYSKTMDWRITITKQGCASDYPTAHIEGDDVVIVDVQSNDMDICLTVAQALLEKWLVKFNGGY